NQPRVIDDFLKLGSSSGNLLDRQVRIAPEISWIKQCGRTQFVGGWYGEDLNRLTRIALKDCRSAEFREHFEFHCSVRRVLLVQRIGHLSSFRRITRQRQG